MKFNVLTLFPEVFDCLKSSITGRALGTGAVELNLVNIRDFAVDNYRTVDDAPYGGGAGQLLKPDVIGRAIESLPIQAQDNIFYLSPRGEKFTQKTAENWSNFNDITLLCGHYEGVDERVLEYYKIREISLGDFVLSGGELAACAMIDAAARLANGVLGNQDSLSDESFNNGLLEYPQYTRPEVWNGLSVPEILLSGHHENIAKWRAEQSKALTAARRPDLLQND